MVQHLLQAQVAAEHDRHLRSVSEVQRQRVPFLRRRIQDLTDAFKILGELKRADVDLVLAGVDVHVEVQDGRRARALGKHEGVVAASSAQCISGASDEPVVPVTSVEIVRPCPSDERVIPITSVETVRPCPSVQVVVAVVDPGWSHGIGQGVAARGAEVSAATPQGVVAPVAHQGVVIFPSREHVALCSPRQSVLACPSVERIGAPLPLEVVVPTSSRERVSPGATGQ